MFLVGALSNAHPLIVPVFLQLISNNPTDLIWTSKISVRLRS